MRYTLEKLQDNSGRKSPSFRAKRPEIYFLTCFLAIRADRRPAGVSTLPAFLAAMRVEAASFRDGVRFGVDGAFLAFLDFFEDLDLGKPMNARNPTIPSCWKSEVQFVI